MKGRKGDLHGIAVTAPLTTRVCGRLPRLAASPTPPPFHSIIFHPPSLIHLVIPSSPKDKDARPPTSPSVSPSPSRYPPFPPLVFAVVNHPPFPSLGLWKIATRVLIRNMACCQSCPWGGVVLGVGGPWWQFPNYCPGGVACHFPDACRSPPPHSLPPDLDHPVATTLECTEMSEGTRDGKTQAIPPLQDPRE